MEEMGYFVLGIFLGVTGSSILWMRYQQRSVDKWKELFEKNRGLFLLMNQWVKLKQEKKSLAEYFDKREYKRIAIYGMSYVGIRIVNELKNSNIEILYGIDRNNKNIYSEVPVYTLSDALPQVDAIVMTVIGETEDIKEVLIQKTKSEILDIEDIVNVL